MSNGLKIGTIDGLEAFAIQGLDPGIAHYVAILRSQGIETCESCQGGAGHSFPEPTINFFGQAGEGLRAVAAAQAYGLPVAQLRRVWLVQDSELVGPLWSMTFREPSPSRGLDDCEMRGSDPLPAPDSQIEFALDADRQGQVPAAVREEKS